MKKITLKFLQSKDACLDGVNWCEENKLIGLPTIDFLNKLIKNDKLDWANWLIARVMKRKQYLLAYAIFAAESVLDIYEKEYPNDNRPRKAIETAKAMKNGVNMEKKKINTVKTTTFAAVKAAAQATTFAAAYAANAAYAAVKATKNAVNAAYAADSAYAASDLIAKKGIKIKILNYGMKLLNN